MPENETQEVQEDDTRGYHQMKMNLLDMIHLAENPYDIICRMAADLEKASAEPGYTDYVKEQLRAVYGFAFQDKKLMTDELRDVEKRLKRIEAARENPEFTEEERIRIGFAAERHKRDIERLKLLIQKAEADHQSPYLVKK